MNIKPKNIILLILTAISFLVRLLPFYFRRKILMSFVVTESRIGTAKNALCHLFNIADDLEKVINERAMAYGEGVHPKHRLTHYHKFFVEQIPANSYVLDYGCGYGALARSIALALPETFVLGLDNNPEVIELAKTFQNPSNLTYLEADKNLLGLPNYDWDIVVLSNVLEHIEDRELFLIDIKKTIKPKKIVIRVPLFERDWKLPLRREVGANYYSDPDHKVEHTVNDFKIEMERSGLSISQISLQWGEIWAVCLPKKYKV